MNESHLHQNIQSSRLQNPNPFQQQIFFKNKTIYKLAQMQTLESQVNYSSFSQIQCKEHNQFINLICLQKQCQKPGTICGICQHQHHKDHQVKPLKYFFHEISKSLSDSKQLILLTSEIDFIQNSIKKQILKIKDENNRKQLIQAFNKYTLHLKNSIKKELSISEELQQIVSKNKIKTQQQLNKVALQYQIHQYQQDQKQSTNQKQVFKPSNQQKFILKKVQEIKQKLTEISDLIKNGAEINDLLTVFIISESSTSKVNYTFSEQFKHTAITITDKIKAHQVHNYSANFALIQPAIQTKKKSFSKKTVKLKIDKLMSWIGIGICYKQFVANASYYFNTDDTGHGAFLLTNDGYSWHHSDNSINSQIQNVSFTTNDIITLTLDPKRKILKFQKQSDSKQYQMPYEVPSGDDIYFCVSLNSHDESVSIVQ